MSSCSLVICVLYVFWKINICQTYLQIFFHLLGCFFSFFYGFLCFPLLWRSFLVQCSPTCLFLLLLTFTIVWNQAAWYFQLCSSSSRLFWLFRFCCDSLQILELFVLVCLLWRNVCLGLLAIFFFIWLFFWYWSSWVALFVFSDIDLHESLMYFGD